MLRIPSKEKFHSFSSFINSISDASNWFIQNSANIISVISTIVEVTEAGGANPKDDPKDNLLPALFEDLTAAAKVLEKEMDRIMPEPPSGNSSNIGPSTSTWADLKGVWLSPLLSSSNGVPLHAVYADISNFMAMNGIPTIVNVGSGDQFDLARLLAEQMFVGVLSTKTTSDPTSGIIIQPLNIGIPHDQLLGTIIYYAIPVGFRQEEVALHSHLRLNYIISNETKAATLDSSPRITLPKVDSPKPPYVSTTIAVRWASVVGTNSIMLKVQGIVGAKENYTMLAESFTSLDYYYTVFTPVDIGPIAVAQAFTDAIQASIPTPSACYPIVTITQDRIIVS